MNQATVLDAKGRTLSPTSVGKAHRLVKAGKATVLRRDPLTVQLTYEVPALTALRERRPSPETETVERPGDGRRILLHICCAPCSTYSVKRLRELGFAVTGYWYNPNIHPFSEHERRRETLADYAVHIDLPVVWEPGYEVVSFMRAVHGREQFRVRCLTCYQMRLERVASVAAGNGFHAFTTTLLISPYQDQAMIREIGQRLASRHGIEFYFENLRRGWAEHLHMTRQAGLYSQRYCGCLYSEWEAQDRTASTLTGPHGR